MKNIIITGSGAGLGKELYKALSIEHNVFGLDIKPRGEFVDYSIDITSEDEWRVASKTLDTIFSITIDVLINCAGANFICPFDELKSRDFAHIMDTNLKSIFLSTQSMLPGLKNASGTIVNVVSNASHMPMTDSFAYNASKGAAAIATRQMARELTKRYGITIFGISPNKLAGTEMSDYIDKTFPPMRGMTYEEGREYQLKSLLTGKETDPKQIADLMAFLLAKKERHEYLSGCILELGL